MSAGDSYDIEQGLIPILKTISKTHEEFLSSLNLLSDSVVRTGLEISDIKQKVSEVENGVAAIENIWQKLSDLEKLVAEAIAESKGGKI
jgi:hypothetical protein